MLSKAIGIEGHDIMFSSNETPAEEFAYCDRIGGIINLDDFTHIEFVEKILGRLPETMSCRYNPGGVFQMSNGIMDNPGDSKYGFTYEQLLALPEQAPPHKHGGRLPRSHGYHCPPAPVHKESPRRRTD